MIKNNKGFALTEILILSAVVIGVLTFMYIQFKNINRGYQYSFKYDTVEGMYLANNIVNFINEDNYDTLVEKLNTMQEGYLDITNCDYEIFKAPIYCEQLIEKSEISQILFTEENLSKIKANMRNLDGDLQEYIKKIKITNTENDYRIIIKYNNNTFTTMRFNKGNAYVQDGLIAYLDGINNTGNGHSNDTTIWKDLSNHSNDATLYNNPTWNNNSITFDGQTNYGRLENTSNIEFPDGATLEARVNVLSFIGKASPDNSIEFFNNWNNAGIGLKIKSNQAFKGSFFDTGWKTVENTNTSNLNEYYTLTLTYNNSIQKIYVNGELVASDTYNNSSVIKRINVPFGIGGNPNPSPTTMDNYANVEFQNILIYNRALTENEVLRNYHADMARY